MLLFIDESGHDHKEAPYEVLAGVAIRERDLWNLIQAIRNAELEFFGLHMADVGLEMKGRKLLKKKVIRFAGEGSTIEPGQRRVLVHSLLRKGWQRSQGENAEDVKFNELVAYGQAVIAFVRRVFELAARYNARTFAAIVQLNAPRHADPSFLRKDYAYLFERFYHYLEAVSTDEMGLVVFDELEKAPKPDSAGPTGKVFSGIRKRLSAQRPRFARTIFCPQRSDDGGADRRLGGVLRELGTALERHGRADARRNRTPGANGL